MPKTLADGRTRLVVLTTAPADPEAPTTTELNAGEDIECRILKSDYRLSATGSDTINEAELCSTGNAVVYGASNYEGTVTVFRYLDAAGAADATNDVAWDAFKEKGTTLWLVEREGPEYTDAWAVADEVDVYEVVTDEPQKPTDRTGFIKRTIPLGVQRHYVGVVAAGA